MFSIPINSAFLSCLLFSSVHCGELVNDNERFPVFEGCQMKYGYFPVHQTVSVTDINSSSEHPAGSGLLHNQALEECQQIYYRQKFCRIQDSELRRMHNYKRQCGHFNSNYLKFIPMVFGMIGVGAFLRTIVKSLKINFPYSILLMLLGMGLGSISEIESFCPSWAPYTKVGRTPPKVILHIFLPILIFESSFNMKSHLFLRSFTSIALLAVPGMLITTFATAWFCQICFYAYKWTFFEALLFGSIISATDPVAVVSILNEIGTSQTLETLVDGESLLNEGVAILLYNIFSEIVDAGEFPLPTHEKLHSLQIIRMIILIFGGGPLFGWAVAKCVVRFLHLIYNDATVEVSVTLCAAYLTYFIAEIYLGISGVMALVFLGITLSSERTCISPEVQKLLTHFWEMLTYLANTVLFVLVGMVITETALNVNTFELEDGYYLLFLYVALNLIRLSMVGIMSPLLARIGYGLNWQNWLVLSWGGLRGAVAICLALQVFRDKSLCKKHNIGPKMLFLTAGTVFLTVLINGSTTKLLLDTLRLTELSMGNILDMANAVRQIRSVQQSAIRYLKHNKFMINVDWLLVEEYTNVENPYEKMNLKAKTSIENLQTIPSLLVDVATSETKLRCPSCDTSVENEPSMEEYREITEEARLHMIKALKVSFWRQYEQGIVSEESLHFLTDLLDKIEDKKYKMVHTSDFAKHWEIKGIFFWLQKKISPYNCGFFKNEEYLKPVKSWRRFFYSIACSRWFSSVIYLAIVLNIVPASVEAHYSATGHNFTADEYLQFYVINISFIFIFLIEFLVKVLGLGFRQYFNSHWNKADFVVLIVSLLEVIVSSIFLQKELDDENFINGDVEIVLKFVRFFRLIRYYRLLHFLQPVIPTLMRFINKKVNKKVFISYDIGKGYVSAVDDVQKFLPQMIEQPKVLQKFTEYLEQQRLDIVKALGLLEYEHPGIALSVKTRHASRAVLNLMKDSLNLLKEDGLLDEKEFDSLMDELEQMMQSLWRVPPYMDPVPEEMILANLSWMATTRGDEEKLYEFMHSHSTRLDFKAEDVICEVGEPPNGIYIILRGLVKIEYVPDFETTIERETYGIIPNMELVSDPTFEDEMADYFTTGTVIGEMGVLTDTLRTAKVTCTTNVTLLHIPRRAMKEALKTFEDPYDSLEARIWKTCGMRVTASLLPMEPQFAGWTLDKVKTYLELSAVPVGDKYKVLRKPDFVEHIIVIYGQVCNFNNMEEIFTAPEVLPLHCYSVVAKPKSKVPSKLLLIGSQDADRWEDFDYEDTDDFFENGSYRSSSSSFQSFMSGGSKLLTVEEIELFSEEEALSYMVHLQSSGVSYKPEMISENSDYNSRISVAIKKERAITKKTVVKYK